MITNEGPESYERREEGLMQFPEVPGPVAGRFAQGGAEPQ
jgi:hypothetical protein